jgi:hypothetical protein
LTQDNGRSALVSRVADALERPARRSRSCSGWTPQCCPGDELLDQLEIHEINARRHAAVGCALIAELDGLGVGCELGLLLPE